MLNAEELKAACAALPGERITEEFINSRIAKHEFFQPPEAPTVLICSITMDNGYSVRGEAACVDTANFNVEIGQSIAYAEAFKKLWPLFGFMLAEKRHIASMNVRNAE